MNALYLAKIYHKRFKPKVNEFCYSGFLIKLDLDSLDQSKSALFSINRFNLFSFYERDHGYKNNRSLKEWANEQLGKGGIKPCSRIELQTLPRVFGFVFNPVSFWFCYSANELQAVICEVNNTFGESHNYLIKGERGELPKEFHVSPFFPVSGKYKFNFENQDRVSIDYFEHDELKLMTCVKKQKIDWTTRNILYLCFRFPFYTIAVVFLIHYQALKLWLKKATFYKLPEKIEKDLTHE